MKSIHSFSDNFFGGGEKMMTYLNHTFSFIPGLQIS